MSRKVTNDIFYIGVDDPRRCAFEGQYEVTSGMCYNSYLIRDEKIAVFDTVDVHYQETWLDHLRMALGLRKPDYLIIQHMEPDHSGSIYHFMRRYPDCTIVSSRQAFTMMQQFYGYNIAPNRLVVTDGDTLDLGRHQLHFVTAPMVHWPEVIMTYDATDKVLFSADAFGKFGMIDTDEYWENEALRYYFGIVGKFGAQVQKLLQKAKDLDIQIICPLHGPYLTENIPFYVEKYQKWSSGEPEERGVVVCYCSVYGHTEEAAMRLVRRLEQMGCQNVWFHKLTNWDNSEAVGDAFRFDKLVLVSTTYNGGVFPYMDDYLRRLKERNFQGRKVFLIENGSWAPNAAKTIKKELEDCKDIVYPMEPIRILSAMTLENHKQIDEMAQFIIDMDKRAYAED